MLTRSQVARLFGVSYQTVVLWESQQRLTRHEVVGTDAFGRTSRRIMFDEEEVRALKAVWRPLRQRLPRKQDRINGENSARAFAMFEEGRSPNDVVRLAKLDPDTVATLWEKYCIGADGILAQRAAAAQKRELDKFAAEMKEFDKSERHRRWREKMAVIRQNSPAPLIFVRQDALAAREAAALVPEEQLPKAESGDTEDNPLAPDQTQH